MVAGVVNDFGWTHMTVLEQEWETFVQRRAELLSRARGQYAVIKGDVIAGTFADEDEALAHGYERFGPGPLLVIQVTEEDEVLSFLGFDVLA
jgi:hypothetical protein